MTTRIRESGPQLNSRFLHLQSMSSDFFQFLKIKIDFLNIKIFVWDRNALNRKYKSINWSHIKFSTKNSLIFEFLRVKVSGLAAGELRTESPLYAIWNVS
jgi:hypothetical protein